MGDCQDGRYALGRQTQMAFVVRDLDAAIDFWSNTLKVGPFVVFEHALGTRHFYHRGQRTPVDFALAFSYLGDAQIELVWQRNDAPSMYTEALEAGVGVGAPHHLAFWPDDMKAAAQGLFDQGFEELDSIRSPTGDVDVYYFKAPSPLGMILEIVPMTESRRVYFSKIRELCERPVAEKMVYRFRDKDDFMAAIADQRI